MPSPHHTIRPLITVIGATGTGKSQLAVDLARALNGEIINADAMQMYEGLPIITNKMTLEERCGVQHHFLGVIPKEQEIRVGQWEGGVRRVIEEIRARGKLPIVVGGTHYYIQALLYPRSLLPDVSSGSAGAESEEQQQRTRENLARKYPILNEPTPQILQKLQEVDPIMAARWHPNDHRKIRRSLEIYYLHNCTPASEVYLLQKLAEREKVSKEKKENESELFGSRFRNLIFWVHAQPDVLNERLGGRVNKMVKEGLFDEIGELWRWYNKLLEEKKKKSKYGEEEKEDEVVDLERGVLQSIGFKEFLPWLNARKKVGLGEFVPEEKVIGGEGEKVSDGDIGEKLEKLRREGLERMKIATVQYARTQVKWIRIKLMNAIREANEVEDGFESDQDEKPKTPENTDSGKTKYQPSNILYLMDSSNVGRFTETVSTPAISIAKTFLSISAAGTSILPDPLTLSELAASCLKPKRDYDLSKRPDLWVRKTCEICGVTTVDQESWRKHEQSGRHKKMVRGRSKWEEAQRWKEKREKGELGNSKKIEGEEEASQLGQ